MQDRLLSAYHSQQPDQCFTVLLHWLMCCADARQVAVGLSQSATRSVFHCVAALVNVLCRCKTGCCRLITASRSVFHCVAALVNVLCRCKTGCCRLITASRSVFHCVAALVNVLCRCKTGCCRLITASRSVFHCVAALVNVLCRCKTGCCGFHDCWRRVYGARTAGRWKRSTFHSWLCTGTGAGTSCLRTWLHLPGENYLHDYKVPFCLENVCVTNFISKNKARVLQLSWICLWKYVCSFNNWFLLVRCILGVILFNFV